MLLEVLSNALHPSTILFLNIGLFCGIIVGAAPGLTATMAVALLLPVTFGMDFVTGIALLLGTYCGGIYGGSITAILIKTPGTAAAAATVLDGYPLAQQGKASLALDMALKASVIGGVISALMLFLVAPQLARLALRFSPAEYFSLALFGLTMIAGISSDNLCKGLLAGFFGLLVSCVGLDPISGSDRLTFGNIHLMTGVGIIPAMVGLFAITELLEKANRAFDPVDKPIEFAKQSVSFREIRSFLKTIVKSGLIGTFVGAVPGTGAATASYLSYNEARRCSSHPETFGTGELDGLAAAESANNGVTGATLIPLLTLGIPGDTITAILLGALIMHGINPGPELFVTQASIAYSVVAIMFLVNIFMLFQGKVFIKVFANVTKMPTTLLLPLLVILCVTGAYACDNSAMDIALLLFFGAVGYLLLKLGFPMTPIVIGMILGPIVESSLRRTMSLTNGDWTVFFTRPISAFFLTICILSLLYPVYKNVRTARRNRKEPKGENGPGGSEPATTLATNTEGL